MKIKLFGILSILIAVGIFLWPQITHAESFTDGAYIPNLYVNKQHANGVGFRYQQARFLIRKSDGAKAYCIEPWEVINEQIVYDHAINVNDITNEMWQKMATIAYFGYGYPGRTQDYWYYLTQVLIWRVAEPTGEFYFTNTLNGTRITKYDADMEAILRDVEHYEQMPKFDQNHLSLQLGETTIITDHNQQLDHYTISIDNDNIQVAKNPQSLQITSKKEGTSIITLTRQEQTRFVPPIVYPHNNSQDMLVAGDLKPKTVQLKVENNKNTLLIEKRSVTNTDLPSIKATLEGTSIQIKDADDNLIGNYIFDDQNQIIIDSLPIGTYYIEEIQSGLGHIMETTPIKVEIDGAYQEIIIENERIEKEITIEKWYEVEDHLEKEANITFSIWNEKQEKIATLTTNDAGIAQIRLPYGTYIVHQETTTEGYLAIDDFTIVISEDETQTFFQKVNYKIPEEIIEVPNTMIIEAKEEVYYEKKNKYLDDCLTTTCMHTNKNNRLQSL